jgi:CMP/dCMP kinase
MSARRSIAISGDLGSGKTTVSIELAERLGLPRVSIGDVHRELARSRGMTALQLNRSSERDEEIDAYIDRRQRELAESGESIIIDSRLGWHFFHDAFKVHLITDPTVAAARVLSRPGDRVESYASLEEAEQRLKERSESEQARFKIKYGVDKSRLRNYSLVCDTTRVAPREAVEAIAGAYERFVRCSRSPRGAEENENDRRDEEPNRLDRPARLEQSGRMDQPSWRDEGDREGTFTEPLLLIDPSRVFPTCSLSAIEGVGVSETDAEPDNRVGLANRPERELVGIGHAGGSFFIVGAGSHRRVSTALRVGERLLRAWLVAEFEEEVVVGVSATAYFEQKVRAEFVRAWEIEHGIDLPLPPHLLGIDRTG